MRAVTFQAPREGRVEEKPGPEIAAADERAQSLLPMLRTLRAEGAISIGAVMVTNCCLERFLSRRGTGDVLA